MELFGKIIAALPEKSGTSARGNQWRCVTYVLETQEQYPKKLAFDVVNDRIQTLNIQVGETLTIQFEIDAIGNIMVDTSIVSELGTLCAVDNII